MGILKLISLMLIMGSVALILVDDLIICNDLDVIDVGRKEAFLPPAFH